MSGVVERRSGELAVVMVGSLGAVTLLAHVLHLGIHSLPPVGFVFGAVLPMAGSASLLAFAVWLASADMDDLALVVASWCLVGSVVLVAVTSSFVVFQLAVGSDIAEIPLVLVIQATFGGLLGFLLGVYDARRQSMERELRGEREAADRLGRRLTVLNRVLRHDVRNAVSIIRGNAEMVQEGTSDLDTVAGTIQEQAARMSRISDQAREIEAALSEEELTTELIDLSTSVSAKAIGLDDRHGYATVHREVHPDVWVEASPLVETALDNLLENAVRHNDAAAPSVWVSVEAVEEDDGAVARITVEDDGPGIPAEQIEVLERGHETALEHTSGLGLWLVHWIVTGSSGTVAHRERDPVGSVVECTLPLARPPQTAE